MNILEQAAARKAEQDTTAPAPTLPPEPTQSKAIASIVDSFKSPAAPKGAFKSLELKRFVDESGKWIEPVDGYFIPKTQEEFDALMHYSTLYNLVEAPTEE